MKVFKRILFLYLMMFTWIASNAQDPTFTQFYSNPLYLNPAFAGSNGCPRFNLNYRNQWPQLSANYITYSASYDQYSKNISGGLGLLATYDQQGQGTISTAMLGLIYSYHLTLGRKWKLLFGARASWYQKSLDWSKCTFGDMIDPRRGFIYATGDVPRGGNRGFFDASAGSIIYNKYFFAGVSLHHMNTPNESMIVGTSNLPMKFTAHAGAEIKLGSKSKYANTTSIMPNILYQYQNGVYGFNELCIGTYVKYGILTAGVWNRHKDAFILSVGINTGKFRLGYSYDVTISKLNNVTTGGSHEISLGFNPPCKKKAISFRTISCPSF